MSHDAYASGFADACAALGLNPAELVKRAQYDDNVYRDPRFVQSMGLGDFEGAPPVQRFRPGMDYGLGQYGVSNQGVGEAMQSGRMPSHWDPRAQAAINKRMLNFNAMDQARAEGMANQVEQAPNAAPGTAERYGQDFRESFITPFNHNPFSAMSLRMPTKDNWSPVEISANPDGTRLEGGGVQGAPNAITRFWHGLTGHQTLAAPGKPTSAMNTYDASRPFEPDQPYKPGAAQVPNTTQAPKPPATIPYIRHKPISGQSPYAGNY